MIKWKNLKGLTLGDLSHSTEIGFAVATPKGSGGKVKEFLEIVAGTLNKSKFCSLYPYNMIKTEVDYFLCNSPVRV